jgi:hypothetical protein
MKVILQHAQVDLYYAGRQHWVGDRSHALNLGTIERATELSCDESFEDMDIVVICDDPTHELLIPVRRKFEPEAESQREAA